MQFSFKRRALAKFVAHKLLAS